MKKTTCIQLVLITAALAGCDRPLYQQGSDYPGVYDPGPYYRGDEPDSSNSCPLQQFQLPPDYYLWYSGLRPFEFYYGGSLEGYYAYRYPATIVRAGFGRSGYARFGGGAHS
jgi:hypothetical protein